MVVYLLLAASALYIAFVEGLHVLALWNCLPVGIGLLVARGLRRGPRNPAAVGASAGFLLGSVGTSLVGHAAWQLDIGGIAGGSSTSALMLLVLPLYALGAGLVGAILGVVAGFCFGGREIP
jgi:hypothetical protein